MVLIVISFSSDLPRKMKKRQSQIKAEPPNGWVGGYGQAIRAMFEYADSPAALAARTR
jgi:hypothetical protein